MSEETRKKVKRVLAIMGLVFIAFCLVGMIVNAIGGGPAGLTLLFLFGLIVVPCVLYIILRVQDL